MWNSDNNCERILSEDNRDKRKASSGARHNSGRRGGGLSGIKGAIVMPSDWLKYNNKTEYKKYIGGSEIMVSNAYSDIVNVPSLEEIRKKDFEAAQSIITVIRKHHTVQSLKKHWSLSGYKLYKLLDEYKITYEKRIEPRQGKGIQEKYNKILNAPLFIPNIEEEQKLILSNAKQNADIVPPKIIEMVSKQDDHEEISHKYNKISIDGATLQKRVLDLMGVIYDGSNYKVKILITEIE